FPIQGGHPLRHKGWLREPFKRGRGNATPHLLTAAPESDLRGRCLSPLIPRGFARRRASRAPGWRSSRERHAREGECVEGARDGVRALFSVPWGERSRDAVNSRPSVSGTVTRRSTVSRRLGLLTNGALSRANAER